MSERECSRCHKIYPHTIEYFEPQRRQCKKCRQELQKIRYDADPEKPRALARQYREQHLETEREKCRNWHRANSVWDREYQREWRKAHPEHNRNIQREWHKVHPTKRKEYKHRYRAKMRAVMANGPASDVTADKIADLVARSKGKCYWCGKKTKKIEIDHITPIAKGGPHLMYNLCVSCPKCNRSKSAKMPQELGRLF